MSIGSGSPDAVRFYITSSKNEGVCVCVCVWGGYVKLIVFFELCFNTSFFYEHIHYFSQLSNYSNI